MSDSNRVDTSLFGSACNCCPYGYHIDLDFVNYCELLVTHAPSMGERLRRQHRRQRQSMEVMLGVESIIAEGWASTQKTTRSQTHQNHTDDRTSNKTAHDALIAEKFVHDALNDVVCDFERTLDGHYTNGGSNKVMIKRETVGGEQPATGVDASQNIRLEIVRNQMAVVLNRTRILEQEVRVIPQLKRQLAKACDEKRNLETQLTAMMRQLKNAALPPIVDQRPVRPLTRHIGVATIGVQQRATGTQADKLETSSLGVQIGDGDVNNVLVSAAAKKAAMPALMSRTVDTQTTSTRCRSIATLAVVATHSTATLAQPTLRSFATQTVMVATAPAFPAAKPVVCLKCVSVVRHSRAVGPDSPLIDDAQSQRVSLSALDTQPVVAVVVPATCHVGVQCAVPTTAAVTTDCNDLITANVRTSTSQTEPICTSQKAIETDTQPVSTKDTNTQRVEFADTGSQCSIIVEQVDRGLTTAPGPSLIPRPTASATTPSRSGSKLMRQNTYTVPVSPASGNAEEKPNFTDGNQDGARLLIKQQPNENETTPNADDLTVDSADDKNTHSDEAVTPEITSSVVIPTEIHESLAILNEKLLTDSSVTDDIELKQIETEWFRIAANENSKPFDVLQYIKLFKLYSVVLTRLIVNLQDVNGNSALHYAVSNGKFEIVNLLLDLDLCNINCPNKAGYTCVMLVSLVKLQTIYDRTTVARLFGMADVNVRAAKHRQTALMLAVTHGNADMAKMLIDAGAHINIQDKDGSTALMCAAEHGYSRIVRMLLAQPDCVSTIQDMDGSTALKISLEAGYRDIGVILYAHEHMLRNKNNTKSLHGIATKKPLQN